MSNTHSLRPAADIDLTDRLDWVSDHVKQAPLALLGASPRDLPPQLVTRLGSELGVIDQLADLRASAAVIAVQPNMGGVGPDMLHGFADGIDDGGTLILAGPVVDHDIGAPLRPRTLIRAVEAFFDVTHCVIHDGWLRLVARKRGASDIPKPMPDGVLVTLTEDLMAGLASADAPISDLGILQQNKRIRELTDLVSRLSTQTARIGAAVHGMAGQLPRKNRSEELVATQIDGHPPRPDTPKAALSKIGVDFAFSVQGGRKYGISIALASAVPEKQNELIATFRFFDADNRELTGAQPSFDHSAKVGCYRYLEPKTITGDTCQLLFQSPKQAARIEMNVASWVADEGRMAISTTVRLQQVTQRLIKTEPAPESFSPLVIEGSRKKAEAWPADSCADPGIPAAPFVPWAPIQFHMDVKEIDSFTPLPRFVGPAAVMDRSGVMTVTFFDEAGQVMTYIARDLGRSSAFDNYAYFPTENGTTIDVPRGAHSVVLDLHAWSISDKASLCLPLEMRITCDTPGGKVSPWRVPDYDVPAPLPPDDAPRVFAIVDEFTKFALGYDAKLTLPTPDNWRELLEAGEYDFVLVESAWRGNSEVWRHALTDTTTERHAELVAMLDAARAKGLKTVFWNKEDPPNYDVFIDSAALFDVIFTTDQDCIPRYKERCGHDRVYALPFFAQPRIHNPIGKMEVPELPIAFAGTWYARRHLDRQQAARPFLDAAMDHGLIIFNRMSHWTRNNNYRFPDPYIPAVRPGISYNEILSLHKMFKLFLNINSVVNSPTMFARRVFEVLACSTPVVSTPSVGVSKMFGDLVPTPSTNEEANKCFEKLMGDDMGRKRLGHQGYREVMQKHTARQRITEMWSKIGHDLPAREDPKVTWALHSRLPENLNRIVENFKRQTYPNLELILALPSDHFVPADVEAAFGNDARVRVIQVPADQTEGDVLSQTIAQMTGDYWMNIDEHSIYLENYTQDMMLPLRYTEARIIGKNSYFVYLEGEGRTILRRAALAHRFMPTCLGSALAVDRRVFDWNPLPQGPLDEDRAWFDAARKAGEKIYSPDIFNFALVRRADPAAHSWQIDDADLIKGAVHIGDGLALDVIRA